jgi:hypothetical protein
MLAAEKHKATFMAPIGIGLTLFVCQLFGTLWTGCGMNPARALGPSVITGRYPGYRESPSNRSLTLVRVLGLTATNRLDLLGRTARRKPFCDIPLHAFESLPL